MTGLAEEQEPTPTGMRPEDEGAVFAETLENIL
jgi:hypothetical protein